MSIIRSTTLIAFPITAFLSCHAFGQFGFGTVLCSERIDEQTKIFSVDCPDSSGRPVKATNSTGAESFTAPLTARLELIALASNAGLGFARRTSASVGGRFYSWDLQRDRCNPPSDPTVFNSYQVNCGVNIEVSVTEGSGILTPYQATAAASSVNLQLGSGIAKVIDQIPFCASSENVSGAAQCIPPGQLTVPLIGGDLSDPRTTERQVTGGWAHANHVVAMESNDFSGLASLQYVLRAETLDSGDGFGGPFLMEREFLFYCFIGGWIQPAVIVRTDLIVAGERLDGSYWEGFNQSGRFRITPNGVIRSGIWQELPGEADATPLVFDQSDPSFPAEFYSLWLEPFDVGQTRNVVIPTDLRKIFARLNSSVQHGFQLAGGAFVSSAEFATDDDQNGTPDIFEDSNGEQIAGLDGLPAAIPSINASFLTQVGSCVDIGSEGGACGPDGMVDNNDFIVFILKFFHEDLLVDYGAEGGALSPDGRIDNNDFVAFIALYFNGCEF